MENQKKMKGQDDRALRHAQLIVEGRNSRRKSARYVTKYTYITDKERCRLKERSTHTDLCQTNPKNVD